MKNLLLILLLTVVWFKYPACWKNVEMQYLERVGWNRLAYTDCDGIYHNEKFTEQSGYFGGPSDWIFVPDGNVSKLTFWKTVEDER